jgi:hypothetical protein
MEILFVCCTFNYCEDDHYVFHNVDRKWHPEKAHVLKVLFPTGGAFGK